MSPEIRKPRGPPCGSVVKNPPARAGDVASIPGPGRPHTAWGIKPVCAPTPEPALWSPGGTILSPRAATAEARAPGAPGPQRERPPRGKAHSPQPERSPRALKPQGARAATARNKQTNKRNYIRKRKPRVGGKSKKMSFAGAYLKISTERVCKKSLLLLFSSSSYGVNVLIRFSFLSAPHSL